MKKTATALLLLLGLAVPELALAVDAREYIPADPGTVMMLTYFRHITASKAYSNGQGINNFNLSENLGILRPVYFTSLRSKALYGSGPLTVDPQALIPFGDVHLDGASAPAGSPYSASGFADPVLLATFWLVNAPEDKLWVGFTPYLTLPIGNYDRQSALNLGGNRWVVRPELGIVKGIGDRTYVDVVLNGQFFSKNDDYGSGATPQKLEQDPLFGVETHVSYDINKQWITALDYYYSKGGETKLDGIKNNDEVDTHAIGVSFFYNIGDHNQLMLQYRDDFSVKNGAGTNTFGARWAYFF